MSISRYALLSKQDDEKIFIPEGETVIGRGPLLKVRDKKVSRSHAVISLKDGILAVKPIHENPTFFCNEPQTSFSSLKRNEWKELKDGNAISLLPESQIFFIVNENEKKKDVEKESDKSCQRTSEKMNIEPCHDEKLASKLEQHEAVDTRDDSNEKCIKEIVTIQSTMECSIDSVDSENKNDECPPLKEVTFQSTMECSIDSVDSENNNEGKDEALSSSEKSKEPSSSYNVEFQAKVGSNSKQNEGRLLDKKRALPSWMTSSAAGSSSSSNSKKHKNEGRKNKNDAEVVKNEQLSELDKFNEKQNADTSPNHDHRPSAKKQKIEESKDVRNSESTASTSLSSQEKLEEKGKLVSQIPEEKGKLVSQEPEEKGKLVSQIPEEKGNLMSQEPEEGSDKIEDSSVSQISEENKKLVEPATQSFPSVEAEAERTKKKLPKCQFGKLCYRKNPVHFQEYSHSDAENSDSDETAAEKPECPFGTSCYRNNPQHKVQFKHTQPPSDTGATTRRSTRRTKRKSVLTGDSDDDGDNTYDYDDSFIDDEQDSGGQSSSYDDDDEDEDFIPDEESENLEELLEEAKQIKDAK